MKNKPNWNIYLDHWQYSSCETNKYALCSGSMLYVKGRPKKRKEKSNTHPKQTNSRSVHNGQIYLLLQLIIQTLSSTFFAQNRLLGRLLFSVHWQYVCYFVQIVLHTTYVFLNTLRRIFNIIVIHVFLHFSIAIEKRSAKSIVLAKYLK